MSPVADRYRDALLAWGGGVAPSADGLAVYAAAVGARDSGSVALFAAAPIGFLPGVVDAGHDHADGGWIPGGAFVAVSPPTPACGSRAPTSDGDLP